MIDWLADNYFAIFYRHSIRESQNHDFTATSSWSFFISGHVSSSTDGAEEY